MRERKKKPACGEGGRRLGKTLAAALLCAGMLAGAAGCPAQAPLSETGAPVATTQSGQTQPATGAQSTPSATAAESTPPTSQAPTSQAPTQPSQAPQTTVGTTTVGEFVYYSAFAPVGTPGMPTADSLAPIGEAGR